MELRITDPKSLKFNPDNPRKTAAPVLSDELLTANIREIGLLQPPLTRAIGDDLMIVVGERRVKAAIRAELPEIPVLVFGQDVSDDRIRALSENTQRADMNPVDQWRAIEAAISGRWTEEAIGTVMGLSVRTIRKLRLLARIHPAMLDQMACGDMPDERSLRTIAAAASSEQASVWRKFKPKKAQPTVLWREVARALEKRRISISVARFDADDAQALGIIWEEDLFEQADKDVRYTTQVAAFLGAQQAWLEANLPKHGVLLQTDDYGQPKLPLKAQRSWGAARASDTVGCYVDPRSGAIEEVRFTMPQPVRAKKGAVVEGSIPPAQPRPEITQKGVAKIGDFRTEALHRAIEETEISDDELIALLVLALAGNNVALESPHGRYRRIRLGIAARLVGPTGLSQDGTIVRSAARGMLREVLSCRQGLSNSGPLALVAGEAIGADAFLPNMATDEFLLCLSKAGIERAAGTVNVLPRQRGKETRAALIAQVGDGRFILAEARFKPNAAQLTDLAALADMPSDEEDPSESIDDVTDLPADGDVALPTEGQERPSVAPLDVAVPAAA